MRVTYETMYQEFLRVLEKRGFTHERAALSAKLYADASRDGVYTHGLNRFPKFLKSIDKGCVDIQAIPELEESFGILERFNGRRGPGNLNAYACMERAIELAKRPENKGKTIVALLPDTGDRYYSTPLFTE